MSVGNKNKGFNSMEICMAYFLTVIGMVMIIEGIPYFGFPEKMKEFVRAMLELPEKQLRVFGFVLMAAGLGLVYIGKCILS